MSESRVLFLVIFEKRCSRIACNLVKVGNACLFYPQRLSEPRREDLAERRAHSQECLQSQARWRVVVSSSVSSSSKDRCNAKDCSGDDLSIRGRGCRHHRCLVQKMPMPPGLGGV